MKLETSSQKEYAMRVCDNAFARSVLGRRDYFSLFQKIDLFADFCLAYIEDVLGYVVLYANDIQGKTAYITLIAVCKDYQNVGVGCSLINWCERTAVQKGMKALRLEVAKDNAVARRFYERHGFHYEEEEKKDSLYMKLALDGRI